MVRAYATVDVWFLCQIYVNRSRTYASASTGSNSVSLQRYWLSLGQCKNWKKLPLLTTGATKYKKNFKGILEFYCLIDWFGFVPYRRWKFFGTFYTEQLFDNFECPMLSALIKHFVHTSSTLVVNQLVYSVYHSPLADRVLYTSSTLIVNQLVYSV